MSDIDTGNHSSVGTFLKLPLYHPLNEFEMDCFNVNEKNLVLGGGSGEHPALKIVSLEIAVSEYLQLLSELNGEKDDEENQLFENTHYKKWEKDYSKESYLHPSWNLEYDSGWDMEHISRLKKRIDKKFEKSMNKFHFDSTKFDKNKREKKITEILTHMSSEEKLHAMIGEFVFYSAKHLLDNDFQNFLKDIDLEKAGKAQIPFDAIQVAPKGYPVYGHYVYKANNKENPQEFKTVWGLRFEDEPLVLKKVYVHKKTKTILKNQT
jgi:hypothetical protein